MPIATGVKGEARRRIVREHRHQKLTDAINSLLEGKANPEYVASRGQYWDRKCSWRRYSVPICEKCS